MVRGFPVYLANGFFLGDTVSKNIMVCWEEIAFAHGFSRSVAVFCSVGTTKNVYWDRKLIKLRGNRVYSIQS